MKLQDKDYCPKLVSDIEFSVLFENRQETSYCMGSKSRDKYIQLNSKNVEAVKNAAMLMQGNRTIENIEQIMLEDYQTKMNILELCEWLCKAGLIENQPEDIKLEKQEMDYLSITIKKFPLKKCYPFFEFLGARHGKKLFFGSLSVIILGFIMGIPHWREFFMLKSYEIQGSLAAGICFILLLFVLSIGIHEFAHAIAGFACGLKPKEIVFALYVGTPMFYVKMPGIYTVAPKKRIIVWSAGIYSNIMAAAVCMFLIPFMDGTLGNMLLICCSTNISLAIANLSPLLPLDGYFILSTLLKRPNLRKGSFQQFKKWFCHKDNSFSGLYVLYFTISVGFYAAFAVYEIRWVVKVIKRGITYGYSWTDYLYEFRVIVMILAVILIKKGLETAMGLISKKRMANV